MVEFETLSYITCMTIGVVLRIVLISVTTLCHFGLKSHNEVTQWQTYAVYYVQPWLNYGLYKETESITMLRVCNLGISFATHLLRDPTL